MDQKGIRKPSLLPKDDITVRGTLSPLEARIMQTVSLLMERGLSPSLTGIRDILIGSPDVISTLGPEFLTFSTFLSLGKRQAAAKINALVRRGLLKHVYAIEHKSLYYQCSPAGLILLRKYLHAHPKPFLKHEPGLAPRFIKLK